MKRACCLWMDLTIYRQSRKRSLACVLGGGIWNASNPFRCKRSVELGSFAEPVGEPFVPGMGFLSIFCLCSMPVSWQVHDVLLFTGGVRQLRVVVPTLWCVRVFGPPNIAGMVLLDLTVVETSLPAPPWHVVLTEHSLAMWTIGMLLPLMCCVCIFEQHRSLPSGGL